MIRRWTFLLLPLVAVGACSERTSQVIGFDSTRDGQGFGTPDAGGVEGQDASTSEPVLMCPVTTCSLPWATCPSSEFPCSTNLLTDNDNCGGCGIRCMGPDPGTRSKWTCVDGQCTMSCDNLLFRDCDNDPANGCETRVTSNREHCGYCGVKCAADELCQSGECRKACPGIPDRCGDLCVDLQVNDYHCGTCGNACDPTGPSLPTLPADMQYGCGNGQCGAKKCITPNKLDCNNDLSDGCEATLHTDEHCGSCFDACPAGKHCGQLTPGGNVYGCLCFDDSEAFCGGVCKSVVDDPMNCGACDRACPGVTRPRFKATCNFGVCGGECEDRYADCDGLAENGCEINTLIDNRNCGGCGNACLPSQVCSGGKCQVTPCDAGAPGDPTK